MTSRQGMSRSAWIAQASRRELDQDESAEVDRLLAAARSALGDAGQFESAELVRAERDR